MRSGAGETKSMIVVACTRRTETAPGRAAVPGITGPAAATENPAGVLRIAWVRTAVLRRTFIIIMPGVLHPLPYIAAHVVNPKPVGFPLPDWMGVAIGTSIVPAQLVQVLAAGVGLHLAAAAGRILPFGLGGQTELLAGR